MLAREAPGTGKRLIAWYRPLRPHLDLRRFLAGRLPAYMLPPPSSRSAYGRLTPTGKVDRRALPDPVFEERLPPNGSRPGRRPRRSSPGCSASFLERPTAGRGRRFFALGGHSLLAARVIARLCEAFGVDLPLAALFESPTVAGLASAVERAGAAKPRRPRARPSPWRVLRGRSPLSPAQAPIWRAARALPGVALLRDTYPAAPRRSPGHRRPASEPHRAYPPASHTFRSRGRRRGGACAGSAAAGPLCTAGRGPPGSARKPARSPDPGAGRRAGHAVRSAQRAAAAGGAGPIGAGRHAHAVPDPASHRGGWRGGHGPG